MCKKWRCPLSGILVFLSLTLMTAGFVLTLAGWVAPANRKAVARVRMIAPLMMTSGLFLLIISCCVCAFNQNRCSECCYEKIASSCNTSGDYAFSNEPGGKEIIPNCYIQDATCDISSFIDIKTDVKQSLIDNSYPSNIATHYFEQKDNYKITCKSNQNPIYPVQKHNHVPDQNCSSFIYSNSESNHIITPCLPDNNTVQEIKDVINEKTLNHVSNILENHREIKRDSDISKQLRIQASEINEKNSTLYSNIVKPLSNGSIREMTRPNSDSILAYPVSDMIISETLVEGSISKSASKIDTNHNSPLETFVSDNDDHEKSLSQKSFAQSHHSIRQFSFPPSACLHHCLSPKSVHRKLLNEKRYLYQTSKPLPLHITDETHLPSNSNVEDHFLQQRRYNHSVSDPARNSNNTDKFFTADGMIIEICDANDETDITYVTSCL